MARNKVMLHIGADPVRHDELVPHAAALEALALTLPDLHPVQLDLAALEMLRAHKAAGLRRRDVEGTWAEIGRRALRARTDLVISQPLLHLAPHGQVPLILDALTGLDVHVVLTPGDDDAAALRAPWERDLGWHHVHVLDTHSDDTPDPVTLAEGLAGLVTRLREDQLLRRRARRERVRQLMTLGQAS